jgi:hypothetical protein
MADPAADPLIGAEAAPIDGLTSDRRESNKHERNAVKSSPVETRLTVASRRSTPSRP